MFFVYEEMHQSGVKHKLFLGKNHLKSIYKEGFQNISNMDLKTSWIIRYIKICNY